MFRCGRNNNQRPWNNGVLRQGESIFGSLPCLANGAMLVVMMLVLAFPVDICRIRPAIVAVFGYAQTMLSTLIFHFVLMHKRKKPCADIAQRQQNIVNFRRHSFLVLRHRQPMDASGCQWETVLM